MLVQCAGIRVDNLQCKNMIETSIGYCYKHLDQRPNYTQCMCVMETGKYCNMAVVNGRHCEYHKNTIPCSNFNAEKRCENYVMIPGLCHMCDKDRPCLQDLIAESAKRCAISMSKHSKPVVRSIRSPKTKEVVTVTALQIPNSLRRRNGGDPETCAVCIEELDPKDKISYKQLQCGHYFHFVCMIGFRAFSCPLCRNEIHPNTIPKYLRVKIQENIEKNEREEELEYEQQIIEIQRALLGPPQLNNPNDDQDSNDDEVEFDIQSALEFLNIMRQNE